MDATDRATRGEHGCWLCGAELLAGDAVEHRLVPLGPAAGAEGNLVIVCPDCDEAAQDLSASTKVEIHLALSSAAASPCLESAR